MFVFGLATVPLMVVFSNMSIVIGNKHAKNIKRASALMVIFMSVGVFMQAITLPQPLNDQQEFAFAEIIDGYQVVNITVDPYYKIDDVQVQKDIPVKLMIHVKSLSGCTANIQVPGYKVNTDLSVGQVHELTFTPNKAENLKITCWMSMINTYLTVVE